MSRKTRKLIWSAPLMAVLAVAGALAIFVVLSPGGAQADHIELPGAPENLTAKADGTRAIDLDWGAPTDGGAVASYRIDRSEDGNEWMSLVPDTGSLASDYKDTGLKPGDTRYYRVFALNSAGTGPVSQDYLVQTAAAVVPDSVRAVTATQTGRNSIMLRWQPPASDGGADITKYRIHVGDNAVEGVDTPNYPPAPIDRINTVAITDTDTDSVIEVDADDGTAYAHMKLNAGIRYVYEVYAVNAVGSSLTPGSSAAATTLELGKPGQPTNLVAVESPDDTILLYWYAPTNTGGDEIQGYRIEVRTDASNDDNNSFGGWGPGPTYTEAEGTSADATYSITSNGDPDRVQFRVYSQIDDDANIATGTTDGVVESVRSSNEVTVLNRTDVQLAPLVPGAPIFVDTTTPPDAVRDAFGDVDLEWMAPPIDSTDETDNDNAPESIGGYRIDVSDDGNSWKQLERQTRRAATEFHYNDPDREDRHYRIFAWHAQTLGPAQAAVVESEFTTGMQEAPGFVKSLRATPKGPTQIDLTWTKPDDEGNAPIVEYRIQTSMRDAAESPMFAEWPDDTNDGTDGNFTSKTTSWPHEELKAGQTWRYRVVAVNDDGEDTENSQIPGGVDGALVAQASTPQEMMPRAPEGLVAEAAKDSNLTGSQDRGVLLLWNAPTAPAGADIASYRVERKVNDGVWEELEDNTDNVWTDFTDIDEPEMDETRAYRVRAISSNNVDGEWAMTYYPQVEAVDTTLGNAMGLVGAVGSEPSTIELTWTAGDNANIHWVFGIHTSNDIASLIWKEADASDSHTVDMTGKPRGSYTFFAIAGQTDDAGDAKWSDWTPGTVTY